MCTPRARESSGDRTPRTRAQAALDDKHERVRSGVATSPDLIVAELFAEWREQHVKVSLQAEQFGLAHPRVRGEQDQRFLGESRRSGRVPWSEGRARKGLGDLVRVPLARVLTSFFASPAIASFSGSLRVAPRRGCVGSPEYLTGIPEGGERC